MIQLPFQRWSLKFHNEEFESNYESHSQDQCVVPIRMMTAVILIQGLTLIITNIVENAPFYNLIYCLGCLLILVVCFIQLNRLKKYSTILLFLIFISASQMYYLYISADPNQTFQIGFCTGIITNSILQHINKNLRLLIICIMAPIKIIILTILLDVQPNIVILEFSTQFIVLSFSYNYEYTARLLFSSKILIDKLLLIYRENVHQSVFSMYFNKRTQSFELDFYNKAAESKLGIFDSESMREVCRSTFLIPHANSLSDLNQVFLSKSYDLNSKRQKKATLEEYAFKLVNEMNNCGNGFERHLEDLVQNVKVKLNLRMNQKNLQLTIKPSFVARKTLIIFIDEEQNNTHIEKAHHQIKYLKKIIETFQEYMTGNSINLFKQLNEIKLNEMTTVKLQDLQTLSLTTLNQIYNYSVFLRQEKVFQETLKFRVFKIHAFLINLESHIYHIVRRSQRTLRFQLHLNPYQQVRTNDKFLIQIILNLVEFAVQQSNPKTLITFISEMESNLNPLKAVRSKVNSQQMEYNLLENDTHKFTYFQNDDLIEQNNSKNSQIDNQKLLKFSIIFTSNEPLSENNLILNPQSADDFMHNNYIDLDITLPITNFLIDKLGPYSEAQIATKETCAYKEDSKKEIVQFPTIVNIGKEPPIQSVTYSNTISFYIYSDQKQISASFVDAIQQKSFLQY